MWLRGDVVQQEDNTITIRLIDTNRDDRIVFSSIPRVDDRVYLAPVPYIGNAVSELMSQIEELTVVDFLRLQERINQLVSGETEE